MDAGTDWVAPVALPSLVERKDAARVRAAVIVQALEAQDALHVVRELLALVAQKEWPALLVETHGDEDWEPYLALRCPVCFEVVDVEVGLWAVDDAERLTAAEIEADASVVRCWYDDPGDFEGLAYMHGGCASLVSLPEGWTEKPL